MKFLILLMCTALLACTDEGGNNNEGPDILGHKNSGKLNDIPTYSNPVTDSQTLAFKDYTKDFEELTEYMDAQSYDQDSYKGCTRTESINPPDSDNYTMTIKIGGSACAVSYEDISTYNSSKVQTEKTYKSNLSTSSNGVFKVENSNKIPGNLIATLVTDSSSESEMNIEWLSNDKFNYSLVLLFKSGMISTDLFGNEVVVSGGFYTEAADQDHATSTYKYSFSSNQFQITILITMSTEENNSSFDKISLNGKEISEEELSQLIPLFSELKNQTNNINGSGLTPIF